MNRKILIAGILVLFLLVAGCAEKKEKATDEKIEGSDASEVVPATGDDLSDNISSNASDEVTSLSQEDLDKLKADLEGMEFDDLGGLSEE